MCRCVHYMGVFDNSVHVCEHSLHRVCTCTRACAVYSLAFGDEGGCVQLFYAGHLLLAWGVIFDMRKIQMLSVFSPG